MKTDIKPCPFCKSNDIRYSTTTTRNNRQKIQRHISMYCNNCHCYGLRNLVTLDENESYNDVNSEKYHNIAISNWNRR